MVIRALFEVVRIHRPLFDALIVAEGAGLAEQLIDESRLAVIDVRDDRHVAEAHGNLISRVKKGWRGHKQINAARQGQVPGIVRPRPSESVAPAFT
jgi:hypothetical protein